MSKIIEASKVFTITNVTLSSSADLALSSNAIDFVPDECIIKSINITNVHSDLSIFAVYSIKFKGQIVASIAPVSIFYDSTSTDYYVSSQVAPNISIKLPNGVDNIVTFTVDNLTGSSLRGVASLVVEFVKHK